MVSMERFELSWDHSHSVLNAARIPIPPHRRGETRARSPAGSPTQLISNQRQRACLVDSPYLLSTPREIRTPMNPLTFQLVRSERVYGGLCSTRGTGRDRTADLLIFNQPLFQLSYSPSRRGLYTTLLGSASPLRGSRYKTCVLSDLIKRVSLHELAVLPDSL